MNFKKVKEVWEQSNVCCFRKYCNKIVYEKSGTFFGSFKHFYDFLLKLKPFKVIVKYIDQIVYELQESGDIIQMFKIQRIM